MICLELERRLDQQVLPTSGCPASGSTRLLWTLLLARRAFSPQLGECPPPSFQSTPVLMVPRDVDFGNPPSLPQPWLIECSLSILTDVMPRKDHGNCECRRLTSPRIDLSEILHDPAAGWIYETRTLRRLRKLLLIGGAGPALPVPTEIWWWAGTGCFIRGNENLLAA